jgi:octaprenyl-diphosphate synthase
MNIKEISAPIQQHLEEFDNYFKELMRSKVSLLDLIVQYITKKKGKRVRPALVFLTAELSGGVSKRSFIAAAMVELLHTATLIHDDVVDEASERRGLASINAAWSNKIAVLFGDYLLSKGLLTAIDNDEFEFLKSMSLSVKRMSEGELLQIQKSKEFNINEEVYFRIISDKTASLLANCCQMGAISATSDLEKQKALYEYGELIGLAFQIRDDIFDYVSHSRTIGKPVGNDLKEKKITLPLIHSLNNAPKSEAKNILKIVKNGDLRKKNIQAIVKFVIEYGGMEYAASKAKELSAQAIDKLDIFQDSDSKKSLINFANFVIERDV